MQFIKDLSMQELSEKIVSLGEKGYRGRQIFQWIYRKKAGSFDEMSDLPLDLRNKLKENFCIDGLKIIKTNESLIDGTTKYLFQLPDNQLIETVLIPHPNRNTVCVSTQVGCKFGCRFCASGIAGFKRNLTAGEIIDQLIQVEINKKSNRINNVVFMGIGEPMDNYENVLKAIRIINSSDGMNIGSRKITISTCGIIPAIEKLADENMQVELSVSLHSADHRVRTNLMPVNKKYPIAKLVNTLKNYQAKKNRQVTFEYLLIKNINDSDEQIKNLVQLTKNLDCIVNLLCYNPVKDINFSPPDKETVVNFQNKLRVAGVKVTLRSSKGADIEAGCGQLRLQYL